MLDEVLIRDLHLLATYAMTGLIWFVQVNHYPLMAYADPQRYAEFHQKHTALTSFVVIPFMFTEIITGAWLFAYGSQSSLAYEYSFYLLLVIWVSTFSLQVPAHNKLVNGFDAQVHRKLVRSNWIRTLGWSARSLVLLAIL